MLRRVIEKILWIISLSAQLLAAMGLGFKWMTMAFRLLLFTVLDLWYFIPNVWWYIHSPTIIRRVSYRSSRQTRKRNVKIYLKQVNRTHPKTRYLDSEDCVRDPSPGRYSDAEKGMIELLATQLNPADGRVTLGLPQQLSASMSSAEVEKNTTTPVEKRGSFNDTLAFIQSYYAKALTLSSSTTGITNGAEGKEASSTGELRNDGLKPDETREYTSSTAESDEEEEDDEDKRNLHSRATLDIYLPIPLDSLFRMMEQEKKLSARSRLHRKNFPIVISVSGGAWIVGYYLWNFLIARLLAARGYIVFCPDYRNFPQTDMEGMVLDVSDAIGWVLQNAERYSGDLSDVTLVGQSAGAHLTMMSLLSQAHLSAHAAAVAAGEEKGRAPPSDVAYNVPRYNPRTSIHHYVGLSGIYNIRGLVKHFDRRGLYRSVLYQIAGGRSNLPRYSLNSYFDKQRCRSTGEELPKNIFDFLPQRMHFIHGDADCSAPVSESANIVFQMRHAQLLEMADQYTRNEQNSSGPRPQPVNIEYLLVPGANHTDAIIEECLSANESHLVDFLCYYRVGDARRDGKRLGGVAEAQREPLETEEDESHIDPSKHPDGILTTPAPHSQRPLLLRWGSYVCPF